MRILFLFVFLTSSFFSSLYASHIVGGEMYYDCLGNNQYRVTIKVYRDCFSTGAGFDPQLPLSIFTGNNQFIRQEDVPFPGSITLPITFNNPCITPPNNICIQESIYTRTITLPPSQSGYILSYQRCCRGPNVQNLVNPDEVGLTLISRIPPSSIDCNSSPRFNNYPPVMLCNNEPLVFDHSATDPDGDELIYELCAPFNGGTVWDPMPTPASNPPYPPVQFSGGHSPIIPLGPGSTVTINPNTGLLNASPNIAGLYAVGICVKEYRNGVLISQTTRDFLFRVINCQIQLAARITPQVELSTFTSFCQGLTVQFENRSFNANSYHWDFGVEEMTSDISTEYAPTYAYPGPGTYNVRLIANPGSFPCSDTTYEQFTVNLPFDVYFETPEPQCIEGNSFDFTALGDFTPLETTLNWNFGQAASIPTSSSVNPSNVVFSNYGYLPIFLTGTNEHCQHTYFDSILVYGIPAIAFHIDNFLYCAPETIHFNNNSTADAPIAYEWYFGDGTTSTQANPSHLYDTPGLYDVTLSITVDEGCIASLTLTEPGAVDIKPSPIAGFITDPEVVDVFSPLITFIDTSEDNVDHWYFFSSIDSTSERTATWMYQDGGYYYPMQVVYNEFGCTDTMIKTVYIIPYTTLYAPNSFTPDGDEINDIFLPVVKDADHYHLRIYTRWGNLIFETNSLIEGWDGTHNGRKMGDGVYVYTINVRKVQDSLDYMIKGHVTLIR